MPLSARKVRLPECERRFRPHRRIAGHPNTMMRLTTLPSADRSRWFLSCRGGFFESLFLRQHIKNTPAGRLRVPSGQSRLCRSL
jgi:hypothetical protein